MREEDIQIGDVLRVREWDDMEREFNLDHCRGIDCCYKFVSEMKYMCGMTFTVAGSCKTANGHTAYDSRERIERRGGIWWNISADMLEPFVEEEFDVASDEDLRLLLS